MIKRFFLVNVFSVLIVRLFAQQGDPNVTLTGADLNNVIMTGVPFLTIAPDSRAGAMGDIGAATSPDINSMHWNAAKYAFMDENVGIALSYSPWLKGITNDIKLLYLTGFKRLDKQQTIAGAVRFFNIGQIVFTDNSGNTTGTKNPSEFTIEAAYSRLFSDRFSGGIAFRFIRSDLASGAFIQDAPPAKVGTAFAADVSVYNHKPVQMGERSGEWAWGVNISNIGTKISYSDNEKKAFLPTNLKVGGSMTINLDQYNKFTFATDLNKLLVPTPPIRNDSGAIIKGQNDDVSVAQGIFQSFYDAPGGLNEELKEVTLSVGCEYWYLNQFALRAGYFNESASKGNRKYFTLGLGIKMNVLTLDFSYLLPAAFRTSPLANTMRFTANFDIRGSKKTPKPIN